MNLDAVEDYAGVDTEDALADVEAAPAQWRSARAAADLRADLTGVDHVVVAGMGGSGIAGDVVSRIAAEQLPVPVIVAKGFEVPAFVGPRTLVVAVSHSGGTQETLGFFAQARATGARLVAITSGGALAAAANDHGAPVIAVPAVGPPRHALGSLVVPLLVLVGLDDGVDEAVAVLDEVVTACGRGVPVARNRAKQLGVRLASGSIPLVWGARGVGAVAAYRLKCQLNENAELVAFHGEVPELGHNEVVGAAARQGGGFGLVTLRDAGEPPGIADRFAATEKLVGGQLDWITEVRARGTAPLARLASLIGVIDLASVYTALALGVDPTPIAALDTLKRAVADGS